MNTNDMDRYFRQTGQRWSSDNRPVEHIKNPLRHPPLKLRWRSVLWLFVVYLISLIFFLVSRTH